MVVAGLAGFGKTMLVAHLLGQLAPSPAVQFVLVDGKGGPDYDQLIPRAWLSAKDDLDQVRDVPRRVHGLMVDRQASIASTLGGTDAWHLGPSPRWPLVVVVIDEAHTFFHERKGTSPEVKAHNALVAEVSRLVEELVRKGRNVAIQVMLLTQRATGDAIPTRIRDNCQVAISFATRTLDGAVAALGEEIRQHPDASPVLLNDPAYVGVAVTSLPGRPGFHRVRTPQVDHHQVAAIIRATTGVVEVVTEMHGHLYLGPPKTTAGRRRVGLPRVVVEALQEHLAGRSIEPDGFVFALSNGGPLRTANFRTRVWRPATRAAGLEGLRIHDLRHTAVALWIAAGAGPKEVATRAGHMSVSFTLDRYGHLYPEADRALRDRLDRFHEAAGDAE
jgi:Phage integrase family